VVDVLRAYALLGIVITHSAAGFLGGRPPAPGFMRFEPIDAWVAELDRLLVFGKFFTIFSFLFGLSFALQMRSAEHRGVGFAGRFTWRLAVLAGIALLHGAFFAGDILIVYAILGLFLIPLRKVSTKALVVTALVLIFNAPGLVLGALRLDAPPTPDAGAAMAQALQDAQRHYEIKRSGTLTELVQLNLTAGLQGKWFFQVFTGRLWITFGLFLLGMCAGRLDLFRDSERNRAFFRKLLWGAGLLALATTIVAIVKPMTMRPASAADLLAGFSFTIQQAALSAFYVAVVTLLYWRNPARGLLARLAPAGRMGLTIYLTQTVFGVLLFYGIGLGMLGRLGVAAAAGCGVAFFCLQIVLARWWMARFSMGPVEWLWRSLTYLERQPNGRGAAQST
jgi:uncharacterized protein